MTHMGERWRLAGGQHLWKAKGLAARHVKWAEGFLAEPGMWIVGGEAFAEHNSVLVLQLYLE